METHSVIATIPLNHRVDLKPVGVAVSPDGKTVYVAGGRGNCVSVIDASTMALVADISAGNRVWGIALSADGSRLYASAGLSNELTLIDTALRSPLKTVRLGQGPWGVAIRGNLSQ